MSVFAAAADAVQHGIPCAMVTVISQLGSTPRESGSRMLVFHDGSAKGTIGGGAFEYEVNKQALQAIADGCVRRYEAHLVHDLGMCCGGRMEVLIEPLDTGLDIVIWGAGHVAQATAPLLRNIGFRVTVVDERDEWLTDARFADCTHRLQDPREVVDTLRSVPVHLVVTHDHGLDQDLIEQLLPGDAAWVGLIGSRAKRARFRTRLLAAGMPEATFDRLLCPVGLSIGAQTPAEIAVSIAGALVQFRRGSAT